MSLSFVTHTHVKKKLENLKGKIYGLAISKNNNLKNIDVLS